MNRTGTKYIVMFDITMQCDDNIMQFRFIMQRYYIQNKTIFFVIICMLYLRKTAGDN